MGHPSMAVGLLRVLPVGLGFEFANSIELTLRRLLISDFPTCNSIKTARKANAINPKSAIGHAECGLQHSRAAKRETRTVVVLVSLFAMPKASLIWQ
jgi:hypothetical protein